MSSQNEKCANEYHWHFASLAVIAWLTPKTEGAMAGTIFLSELALLLWLKKRRARSGSTQLLHGCSVNYLSWPSPMTREAKRSQTFITLST
eukprot:1300914-Pleurochrysis_carterae.AAC.2